MHNNALALYTAVLILTSIVYIGLFVRSPKGHEGNSELYIPSSNSPARGYDPVHPRVFLDFPIRKGIVLYSNNNFRFKMLELTLKL